ncbi:hypothetical protein N9B45_02680 [bacterium]|nr:hypothetical protein [bacterium]
MKLLRDCLRDVCYWSCCFSILYFLREQIMNTGYSVILVYGAIGGFVLIAALFLGIVLVSKRK